MGKKLSKNWPLVLISLLFTIICLVNINMFARFDEIPSLSPEDTCIKETKHHRQTHGRKHGRTDMKTVYSL